VALVPSSIALSVRAHEGVLVEDYRYSIGTVEPLGRHVHDTWQFGWSPDSGGEHWLRGAVRAMPQGSVSIIAPGEAHAPSQQSSVNAPATFMMAYLNDSVVAELASELFGPARGTLSFGFSAIAHDPALSRLFACAHRSSFSAEPLARDSAWLSFLTRLLTHHADVSPPTLRSHREPRAVGAALAYLRSHSHDRITLRQLAGVANITPTRLCRAFARHVGLPPYAYQLRMRIDDAKRLLLQGHAVADVAAATGFADQSHLGRHFKRIVGAAPSAYRSAQR
jgi:AraC-like DNA-binding protein